MLSNTLHAQSHAHNKLKRQVVFPAYIQPIHAARPSQTPACTDPRDNNDPAAPATHLLLFHKHAPSEPPHSAQAPPTLQEHPRRTERKQTQQCGNVYQVADQAAEGEEQAGGCREGERGAVDGGGGLARRGVGNGRGVVHGLGDTGGEDGGGDWAGGTGVDDGGVLKD
ncbi:hypothetical protein V502_09940, partial [Pseudogymnoascus sp. VKM F-4520 (FW-2644)]